MFTFRARVLRIFAGGLLAILCWAGAPARGLGQSDSGAFRPDLALLAPRASVESFESELEALAAAGDDTGPEAVRLNIRLGWALIALSADEGGEALDRALVAFDTALNAWTEENSLALLGMAQAGLGRTYAELALLRDPEENIKAALAACDEAVVAFIRIDDGYGYALTQSVLALTRLARARSLNDADDAMEALDASNEALQIFESRAFPLEFAQTQFQIGLIKSFLAAHNGDEAVAREAQQAFRAAREIYARQNISLAAERVDQGLTGLADSHPTLTWTEAELARLDEEDAHEHGEATPAPPERVEPAPVRAPAPKTVVPTPGELAYEELQRGYASLKLAPADADPLNQYKQAVTHFQNALQTYTQSTTPVRWAEAQNGLGAAYWGLRSGAIASSRVEESIAAFRRALEVYTRDEYAEQFAVTQSHLGAAYHFQARESAGASGAAQALESYEAALKVWSAEGRPVEYARLCNSVADLYLMLAERTDPERYARLALQMLEAAVKAQDREANPRSYAESKAGMGRAWYRIAKVTEDPAHLRSAAEANLEPIEIYKWKDLLDEYSALQGLQGTIYLALSYHENRKENVALAVEAYSQSLETMPASSSAHTRSTTRINLGTAYYQLAQMSQTEKNGALAIEAFQKAQEDLGRDESNPLFEAASARAELVNKLLRETRYVFGEGGT